MGKVDGNETIQRAIDDALRVAHDPDSIALIDDIRETFERTGIIDEEDYSYLIGLIELWEDQQ